MVADDHALFRTGLIHVLDREPDLEIVGEAVNGKDAVERVGDLQPDVVLLDINMPIMDGITALPLIREAAPQCQVVVLTQSSADEHLYQAVKAGASGYLLKEVSPEEIAEAIRRVVEGEPVLSHGMSSILLRQYTAMVARDQALAPGDRLSQREREVLELLCEGLNNRDIGGRLFISENTVKNHVRNILDKLGLASRVQVIAYAVREGMLSR